MARAGLTTAERARFEAEGYLVVPDAVPGPVLDAVRAEYAGLLDGLYAGWLAEGRVPECDGDFFDKLLVSYRAGCDWFQPMDISLPGDRIMADTPFHAGPAAFDLLTCGALLDIVEDLIGPEITSNPIQHVRLKPPVPDLRADEIRAHVGGTDWHQDRAVAHAEADATRMVTVWIAVTDATLENGCLQVIPGRPRMYPHCPRKQTAIADGVLDHSAAVPLPVRAGSVVILHPLTPHASRDNLSEGFRWSFDIRYSVTGEPTGRAHFPDFVARSAAAPETVLRDWREWRRMWRDARAALAPAPHIPIHRWTADSPACA